MLDLQPIKDTLAKYQDRGEDEEAEARQPDVGERQRASLYYLNLAAFMGERHVPALVAEVETLRIALAGCLAAMRDDALDCDGYTAREINAIRQVAPLVGITWDWKYDRSDEKVYTMTPNPVEVIQSLGGDLAVALLTEDNEEDADSPCQCDECRESRNVVI